MLSKEVGDCFICLTISTGSNSDVFHAVPGYFKYRLYPTLKRIKSFRKYIDIVVQQ